MGGARRVGLAETALKGALAGLAATWTMDRITTFLYEHEDEIAKRREERARDGASAYAVAAQKAASLVGRDLSEAQSLRVGSAIHWTMGTIAGVKYALIRRRVPAIGAGRGLLFGTLFFLAVDELLNPLLNVTRGPRAYPWQAHARGLAGHLAFGLTTDSSLQALDGFRPTRRTTKRVFG